MSWHSQSSMACITTTEGRRDTPRAVWMKKVANTGMSFEETLGAIIEAKLAPVLAELRLAIHELRSAPSTQKEFLSVAEVAELFDVSETTVREWMAKGLRQYKQGRVLRVRRAELLAFLSANAPEVEPEVDVEKRAVTFLAGRRG